MENRMVLDLAASAQAQPARRTSLSTRTRRMIMRSPEEKKRAIDLYNAGKSKAEVSRIMSVPQSTLRDWIKEAVRKGLVAHMSSSESSPCSPDSNDVISLADSDDDDPVVIDLDDQEQKQPRDYTNTVRRATKNVLKEVQVANNNQKAVESSKHSYSSIQRLSVAGEAKGCMEEAKKVTHEMMQLLALQKENLRRHSTIAAPVRAVRRKRKRQSLGYSEEARNVTGDWLQLQQQQHPTAASQSAVLNPISQQTPKDINVKNDPKMQQVLLQQQLMQQMNPQMNPFANPAMVQQWQQLQQMFLLSQMMRQSQNQQNLTPQPPNKRRKISPLPFSETLGNEMSAKAQNLSMDNYAAAAHPDRQPTEPVSILPASQIPMEVKQKRRRRSKLEIAMAHQSLDSSGTGQQLQLKQLAIPSPNLTQIKHSENKGKLTANPMAEWNNYFCAEYFVLQDYLLMQQQAIGEKITAGLASN